MQTRKKARLLTGVLASVGLILTGVVVVASPASAVGPTSPPSTSGGTITITQDGGAALPLDGAGNPVILPGQTIEVNGAGFPASTHLYVSYCGNPPGALNCNQIVGDYADVFADGTGAFSTDLVVKNTIIKGTGVPATGGLNIDCTVAAGTCTVGTSNADVPSDTSHNTVLPFAMPKPALSAPSSGAAGVPVSVSGSDYPVGPGYRVTTTAPFRAVVPVPAELWMTQCANTATGPRCATSGPQITAVTFPGNTAGTFPAFSYTPVRTITISGTPYDCATPGLCYIGTSNKDVPQSRGFDAMTPFTVLINPFFSISGVSGQSVTNAARAGNTITVDGTDFTSGAVTAQLCADAAGTSCDAAGTSNNTITAAGDGTVDVTGTATTGARFLVLSQGSAKTSQAITILGTPTLAPSSAIAGPGDNVTFTGSDWNPGELVTVDNGVGSVTANATGGLPSGLSWNAAGAPGAVITFNGSQAAGPSASTTVTIGGDNCTSKPVKTTCSLTQTLLLSITGGNLSMSKVPGTVKLGDASGSVDDVDGIGITLDGQPHTASGSLREVTVVDARGGSAGWSLTGVLGDFGNGSGGSIPATDVTWTPQCNTVYPGTGVGLTTGNVQTLDNSTARDLCTIASNGGGTFLANAALSLPIAPFQAPGQYSATLTLTLG